MVSPASLSNPQPSPAARGLEGAASSRFSIARASLRRLRDIALIASAAGLLSQVFASPPNTRETDRAAALAAVLRQRGLEAEPRDIVWVDPPRGVMGSLGAVSRAVVRGRDEPGEPADLY